MDMETQTGSNEVGKHADFIVLDRNLFTIPVDEISEARVELTMFNDRVVYLRAD
jgi:predicted amidohydrolase YtcJ